MGRSPAFLGFGQVTRLYSAWLAMLLGFGMVMAKVPLTLGAPFAVVMVAVSVSVVPAGGRDAVFRSRSCGRPLAVASSQPGKGRALWNLA